MGTTEKGFRWPAGTDKVVDGDDAIHNLATDADNSTWSSVSTPVSVATSSTASAVFTFPVGRFAVPPYCYGNATSSQGTIASPGKAQSASSCTMTMRNLSASGASTMGCALLAVASPLAGVLLADAAAEPLGWTPIDVACVNPDCAAFGIDIEIWIDDESPLGSITCGTCGQAIPLPPEVN